MPEDGSPIPKYQPLTPSVSVWHSTVNQYILLFVCTRFFWHCFTGSFIFLLGALFSILASAESLCNFCSQLIFNPLYTWTINELKGKFVAGTTFFINAGILLIPMALIG